jgi:hypothetical protein
VVLMATEILRPNAAGDECTITYEDGATCPNHYQNVDEATPDEDATRVKEGGQIYHRDLYNLSDHSTGSGTINSVTVYTRCRVGAATINQASLKIAIKSGSTVSESPAITMAQASVYQNDSYQWTTDPNTGSAWTWAAIDALQAGVSLKACDSADGGGPGRTSCTQVYVEVDYTPSVTGKTSSDTGAGVDAYVSLETGEAKTSSDVGAGAEGIPMPSATLTGSETSSGIEALIFRLLSGVDTGTGTEVAQVGGLFQDLFASERGWGYDSLTAKIEIPTKGGGMKLWT